MKDKIDFYIHSFWLDDEMYFSEEACEYNFARTKDQANKDLFFWLRHCYEGNVKFEYNGCCNNAGLDSLYFQVQADAFEEIESWAKEDDFRCAINNCDTVAELENWFADIGHKSIGWR